MAASPDEIRIGVSIAVPEPFAGELVAARHRFGDPVAGAIPPHITLVGPTVVKESDIPTISAHLEHAARQVSSFVVHLRSSGTFRPVSRVVFVQVAQGIAECEQLEKLVRSGPLAQTLRFHYHPHVTVAHDVPDTALNVAFEDMARYEASFAVNDIQLFEHGNDNHWRSVAKFGLNDPFDDKFPTVKLP